MKIIDFLGRLLRDVFFDATNTSLDIGRLVGAAALGIVGYATHHNMTLGKEIDLSPTGLPGGLAVVLGALAVYIVKDRQSTVGKAP